MVVNMKANIPAHRQCDHYSGVCTIFVFEFFFVCFWVQSSWKRTESLQTTNRSQHFVRWIDLELRFLHLLLWGTKSIHICCKRIVTTSSTISLLLILDENNCRLFNEFLSNFCFSFTEFKIQCICYRHVILFRFW